MTKALSHRDISKKGGLSTLANHGKGFYSSIGKKGAENRLKKYGKGYYKKLALAGVEGKRIKKENKSENSSK